ncbi:MAG: aldo/keto reductase [Bryobacterales bacterium]
MRSRRSWRSDAGRLLSYGDQEKGSETVRMAIDSGITYIDTAQDYGNGRSETWVGEADEGQAQRGLARDKRPGPVLLRRRAQAH